VGGESIDIQAFFGDEFDQFTGIALGSELHEGIGILGTVLPGLVVITGTGTGRYADVEVSGSGTAIDRDALERGTSLYLPGLTVPMLPECLSNNLCSLMPDVDRLALSLFMDIEQGKIVLVMGNEAEGLADRTQKKCDFLVALPQVGEIASLNVAQASTALMYEWLRQNWGRND
jgi:hypothetical protein